MKKIYLLSLLVLAGITTSFGQRFMEKTFDAEVSSNIEYGSNFTVIAFQLTGHSFLQPLMMDVYQPTGDVVEERPLIIYMHTGNFLPIITNGAISGTKSDSATVEICTRYAEMGYVVASIDYRVGWNPFGATQPDRAFSLINAAYRGIQDLRTSIRYFKKDYAENGNQFRIDPNRITCYGQGTGGYITLTAGVLDDYIEIPTAQNPQGKFLTNLDADTNTLEPMIIVPWNGDIYGTSVGIFPLNQDTFCKINHAGYDSDYQLTVNLGGAMADISWLEAGDVPVISFHAPNDGFAPYYDDILRVGTNNDAVVQVQGSHYVAEMSNTLGNNDVFLGMDDVWTDAAIAASAKAGHVYYEALYPIARPANQYGRFESAPWEWWTPSIFDTIPHPFVTGLSIHEVALLNNANMSKQNALTFIDTIIGYTAPRMFRALDLDNWTGIEERIEIADVNLVMSPNPATDVVNFSTNENDPMLAITIYDNAGRVVATYADLNKSQLNFNVEQLPTGMYYTNITFEKGFVLQKLVINRE